AYDGTVHSFKDNRNYGDYGPCVILKHDVKGFIFFTLYGHLSKETLEKLTIDQKVIAGEPIGHLGFPEENGDYPPHLHFQIILDLENYSGDYPGVSNTTNLSYFLNNCPDPNLLIKIY
ncbi:MAG: peptidoglycan DD-metalloendopeptidase family protein, partial [Leeuwenhoekiella sp.]